MPIKHHVYKMRNDSVEAESPIYYSLCLLEAFKVLGALIH